MTLSRRRFLHLTGIAAASSQVAGLFALPDPRTDVVYGRALKPLSVYRNGQTTRTLWPDAVLPLHRELDGWYETDGGYVERSGVQPMPDYVPVSAADWVMPAPPHQQPIAEVVGAVAPVRAYASAGAPLVTRIGHGGVARVADVLPDEDGAWLGLADDSGYFYGWSQARVWRPVTYTPHATPNRTLQINASSRTLTVFEAGNTLISVSFASRRPPSLPTGRFPVYGIDICHNTYFTNPVCYGVGWPIFIDGIGHIAGAYWHNLFGERTAGHVIQVMPAVARWLATWMSPGSEVTVV